MKILVDTDVLFKYLFASEKNKMDTFLFKLRAKKYDICISNITYYEFLKGKESDNKYEVLKDLEILPLSNKCSEIALNNYNDLIKRNKKIGDFDILIASVAISNNLELATENINHFERIKDLNILDLKAFSNGNLSGCHENKPIKKPLTKKEREQILSDLLKKSPKK